MPDYPISLRDLQAFDADVRTRIEIPPWADPGVGCLGLILGQALDEYRYNWCTPLNCRTFASTGGEGVHFSLLLIDGLIGEESPVVVTTPSGDGRSWIVGSNMRDFLALGYYRGYFAIEQLSHDQMLTLSVFTNKDWRPSESWHHDVGYTINLHQQQVLDLLIKRFMLQPWESVQHFYQLQERYGSVLELPPEMLR